MFEGNACSCGEIGTEEKVNLKGFELICIVLGISTRGRVGQGLMRPVDFCSLKHLIKMESVYNFNN